MIKVYYGLTNHSQVKRTSRQIPIMISGRWLLKIKPKSCLFNYLAEYVSVFLDSGAFGAAFYDGGFNYTVDEYTALVKRLKPEFWASMDYPCEPNVRNGMSVDERIHLTVENAVRLDKENIFGFVPVIQGWLPSEYLYCIDALEAEGLIKPVMGIGSICRRGKQEPIVEIIRHLCERLPRVKFHAFGVKINTLKYNNGEILNYLDSIDTAAWQFNEKDELGGWKPRTYQEIERRLKSYKVKLDIRMQTGFQLILKSII